MLVKTWKNLTEQEPVAEKSSRPANKIHQNLSPQSVPDPEDVKVNLLLQMD